MEDWIRLNSIKLNPLKETVEGGVTMTIGLSPHDVPIAVRGLVVGHGKSKRFVIEFKYLDEEPWRLESGEEGISVRVGKHSKRLYGVEIDGERIDAEQGDFSVALHVREAAERVIEDAASRPTFAHRTAANFRAAKAGIESVSGRLFQVAAH